MSYEGKSIYPEVQDIKDLDQKHHFEFALDFHCPTLVLGDHQVMYFVGAKEHPKHNLENVTFAPPGKATDPASGRKYGATIQRVFVETRFIEK